MLPFLSNSGQVCRWGCYLPHLLGRVGFRLGSFVPTAVPFWAMGQQTASSGQVGQMSDELSLWTVTCLLLTKDIFDELSQDTRT